MRTISKHSQLKKTPAGESGSASCSPLPDPGTVNTDPAGAYYMNYQEQIKSPQWQKRRLEILQRDKFTCQICGDKKTELHVHHIAYLKGRMAWDYSDKLLATVCSECHESIHTMNYDAQIIIFRLFKKFGTDAVTKLFSYLIEISE